MDQVLALWDRLLAFDSLELGVFFVISLRRSFIFVLDGCLSLPLYLSFSLSFSFSFYLSLSLSL